MTHSRTLGSGLPKYNSACGQVVTHFLVLLSPNLPSGHFLTHFQVESSAKYPGGHPSSHLLVNSSAYFGVVHLYTHTLPISLAKSSGTSGHFGTQSLVELSA